ncbi:hypothetical protein EYF80_063555 [Liparis tanakae]|uniref:Uncharacterized protein n=1 Tax=Liparis tanakae TaxID=230148 RepID=A0A4Z2EC13_9TELE|nr:hypothetical protein EYF80_063555 [Liparis tanakae]
MDQAANEGSSSRVLTERTRPQNHRDPQQSTEIHRDPQRTTENHREPQRTTEIHRDPQRTT